MFLCMFENIAHRNVLKHLQLGYLVTFHRININRKFTYIYIYIYHIRRNTDLYGEFLLFFILWNVTKYPWLKCFSLILRFCAFYNIKFWAAICTTTLLPSFKVKSSIDQHQSPLLGFFGSYYYNDFRTTATTNPRFGSQSVTIF